MIAFADIDKIAQKSKDPLWELEQLQQSFFGDIRQDYYRFLYHLVSFRKPKLSVEIGIHYGTGSGHMAEAAMTYGGHVIGIDLLWPSYFLKQYDANFHFIKGDSVKSKPLLKLLVEKYGPIGVVFQDSSHHYKASCEEWDMFSDLLDENAIWVCDDITESFYREGLDEKSMVGYFEERPGEKRLYKDLHTGSAIGVILR